MRNVGAVLLWVAMVGAAAVASSGLTFDSDQWLPRDHPLEQHLDYLDDEFEKGETLSVIVSTGKDFFSDPALFAAIDHLEQRLSRIPGVLDSHSPMSANIVIRDGGSLHIRSFTNALATGVITDADQFRTLFTASPYHGTLLSEDGRTVAIHMRVDTRRRAAFRSRLIEAVERDIQTSPLSVSLAGDAALHADINRTVRHELFGLLAAGAVVVAAFLLVCLRNRSQVAALMACLVAAVAQCLATMHLLDHSVTPVSLALPLMVAVIASASGLHIFAIWDQAVASAVANPLRATIGRTWLPCLVAHVTSAVGFGAFVVSELIPVRHFGMDSLAAILLGYPLLVATAWGALWLCPASLSSPPPRDAGLITGLALRVSDGLAARAGTTALAFGGGALLLAVSLLGARTETNFLHVLFKTSSPIAKAFDLADRHLGGSGSIEVVAESGRAGYFRTIEHFDRVGTLVERFTANPLVNHADSYLLPLEITHRPLAPHSDAALPRTGAELAQELFFLELSRGDRDNDLVSPYLNFDSSTVRLDAHTPNLASSDLDALIAFARSRSSALFPDARILVTGSGAYVHQLSRYVLSTQARSFALTFAVIGALFLSVFGLRAGLAGLLSNMFPVLLATGMIALLNVPFDFATILIAGVTLGLSVDDSIHFLHHYQRARRDGADVEGAIGASLSMVARPIVLTSLLFCAALAVFGSSSLVVMIKFALFTTAGLIAAMLSALVLLPALVRVLCGPPRTANPSGLA